VGEYGDSREGVENLGVIRYSLSMTKLEKIEQDIAVLDPKDVRKLADWLEEYKAELWDRQMESDVDAGRLDQFIAEAKAEIASGKLRDL
jgi:hypothetical protein